MTISLERDAHGLLVFVDAAGQRHAGVQPVRAFPLSAPGEGVALMSADGHELAWFDAPDVLDSASRALLDAELSRREFMPRIRSIVGVSSFSTPCDWDIVTDRGATRFTLRSEDDIRRLGGARLLIADSHGIHYEVADMKALDRASRRILDRFL
ncbi:DUF1854 domain-containing protein [Methyloversatilis sp.]|uniref:cyanophycin metabolism-associated DUF1854 family protein n=1 Tax=Methyloversatilis sp. TaxID=2569862 RepID=UPI0035AE55B7